MLGPILGDFNTEVGLVHQALLNSVNLVSEHQSIFFTFQSRELIELHGFFRLFGADYRIALLTKFPYGLEAVFAVLPRDAEFGAEGGFVDFCRWGSGADAAQNQLVSPEGVGRSEGAAHIERASYSVKHYDQSGSPCFGVFVCRDSSEFDI